MTVFKCLVIWGIIVSGEQYSQGMRLAAEEKRLKQQQHQQHQQQEVDSKAQEAYLQKIRGDDKRSPKVNHATDLLQVFAPDSQANRNNKPQDAKNRSMTAANLIDAIIVHQINLSTEETNTSSTPTSQNSKGCKQDMKPSGMQSGGIPSSQPYRPGPQSQMPYTPHSM